MNWQSSLRAAICCAVFFLLAGCLQASSDLERHLRDELQGKTFVLRDFYSGDHLHYDSGGAPVGGAHAGDWMSDGFISVKELRFSHHRLAIEAERLLVIQLDQKEFQFLSEEHSDRRKLKIDIDLNPDATSLQEADALSARIFLTPQDNLAALVSDYWRPCVLAAALGNDKNLRFSPELLTIPGVAVPEGSAEPLETNGNRLFNCNTVSRNRIGEAPRAIYSPQPEFSERARRAKFQGVVLLGLVVNEEGLPTNIHVVKPLGYGLDEKALSCVGNWKFKPAEKDGQPVASKIVVEVSFHLY